MNSDKSDKSASEAETQPTQRPSGRNRPILSTRKKVIFTVVCASVITLCVFSLNGLLASYKMYRVVSATDARGWRGSPHTFDPLLGYKAIPGATGSHTFPVGPSIPMRYDSDGFRVPVNDSSSDASKQGPKILFLGCSFTYGDACAAKDTFPQIVGKATDGTVINAGKCSYGLCQMVILARQLIPKFNPDYVVVQYSGWLRNRAVNRFMPSYVGKLPGPYYGISSDGTLAIQRPVFRTKVFDLPIDDYRGNPDRGFPSFCLRVGMPLFVHDAWKNSTFRVGKKLGLLPKTTSNLQDVTHEAYTAISENCNQHGAEMLVLVLGRSEKSVDVPNPIQALDTTIVNAHATLLDRLASGEDFDRAYHHWRGNPPQKVDGHPNAVAHGIIASALLQSLGVNDEESKR